MESFGRPVTDRLDPPLPDVERPNVIQVEPPKPARAGPPGGRSRRPKAAPPAGPPPPTMRTATAGTRKTGPIGARTDATA